jgi:hypothetical protein
MSRSRRGQGRSERRTERRQMDWSLTGGGPAANTALAALGLTAAAATGAALEVSPIWGAAAGVAGAATSVVIGAVAEATPTGQVIRIGQWVTAGGWLTWCLATTVWDVNALLALVVGAAVSAGLAPLTRTPAQKKEAGGGSLVLSATSKLEREWEQRLARITRQSPYRVTKTTLWETGAGYTLTVELPSGMTRRSLGTYTDALAADARLPEGCGVEPDKAPHRGAVLLHVATVDRMREALDYPDDFSPRSILDPIVLGEHRDSSPAQVAWREHSAIIAGQKGSGKTTMLNVATAGVGRCRDALVWHIDLTGGGLSRAWLEPWLRGKTDRPAIDWAVCTEQDAEAMVRAALAISIGRKASAFDKKMAANTSLLPVDETLPEIVLFVDEGKTLLSPNGRGITGRIRDGLEQLQDIARDSAVNPVLSTLRATSDTLSPGIKKQAVTRIGMAGSDDEEIAYLLGWKNLSVDDLAGPGTAFLTDGAPARPMRGYNLAPRRIGELAEAISARQPALEEASQSDAGAAYANRYARMKSSFGGGQVATRPEPGAVAVPTDRPTLRSVPMDAANWLSDTPAAPAAEAPGGGGGADLSGWLTPTEQRRQTPTDKVPPAPASAGPEWDGVPEILTRALEVLDRAGDDRIHSEDLAAALGMSKHHLAEAMGRHGISTLPNKFSRGGSSRRGYGRESIDSVAQRHHTEVAGTAG